MRFFSFLNKRNNVRDIVRVFSEDERFRNRPPSNNEHIRQNAQTVPSIYAHHPLQSRNQGEGFTL